MSIAFRLDSFAFRLERTRAKPLPPRSANGNVHEMKALIAPFYAIQNWFWRRLRPRTNGVKVLLFDANGKLVLIRNAYGRSDQFVLPGGGIKSSEEPAQAAAREVREELGSVVNNLLFVATYTSGAEGKRDTIHLYRGQIDGELSLGRWEVAEAGFYDLGELPASASPATRRRIEEHLGKRPITGDW
jgi:8-oxo-dGTP pyrophosphatase MutT (NUDIX family)